MRTLLTLLFISFVACGDKDADTANNTESDTETNTETDSDTDTDTDTDTETSDESPVIEQADAWCFTPGGSTEGDQWGFTFTYSDPQGNDTIPRLQTDAISIKNAAGAVISTQSPACDWNTAECISFVFTTQVNVGCEAAGSHTVQFQIVDDDGNLSNALEVTGRQGTDFEG